MLRRGLQLCLALALPLPALAAFKKAYFAGTVPGSWAKYTMKDTASGQETQYTYSRLADDKGQAVIEVRVEYGSAYPDMPWSLPLSFTGRT